MNAPIRDDEPLNLDSLSFEELGRIPDCRRIERELPAAELNADLIGPHYNRRCETSERELLRNSFPTDLC